MTKLSNVHFEPEKIRGSFYKQIRISCDIFEQRLVITFLLFFGILCNFMQRICFNITLVEMTKRAPKMDDILTHNNSDLCPYIFLDVSASREGQFRDWSDATQGHMIASFFVGNLMTGVLGGFIADKYGAKHIFAASIILSSTFSLLTPLAATSANGSYLVILMRFLMGVVQGPMFPSGAALMSKWSPPHERNFHTAVANSGVPMASFIGNLLAGIILDQTSWEWVFYIYGSLGVVCFLFWEVLVFSSPGTHKYISAAEKTFIEYSIQYTSPITRGSIPWKKIFKSKKFSVIVFANFGFDWGFSIVSLELPFYLYHVLHLPILKVGTVASMPWFCMWIGAIIFGFVSQLLISEGIIRKLDMRKTMAVISTLVPASLLILASWASCSHVLVCLLFSLSMFYAGAVYSGLRLSVMDLAPNFSGVLMSLVSTSGNLAAIGVPLIIHSIIEDGGTLMEWRMTFWIATVFMFVSSIPYLILATCKVQEWNRGFNPVTQEEPSTGNLSQRKSRMSPNFSYSSRSSSVLFGY